MANSIEAKNLSARLNYEAKGNPPGAHPKSAVGNFFPGLEFNFLNVWKRVFIGIELLESSGEVVGVDPRASQEIQDLLGDQLFFIDAQVDDGGAVVDPGIATFKQVRGPARVGEPDTDLAGGIIFLEWGNLLADVHHRKGGTGEPVVCIFRHVEPDGSVVPVIIPLLMRRILDDKSAGVSDEANLPGELTESLCSPWQTDFIGCACYYWAANRPDYINTWSDDEGNTGGHNWLNPGRELRTPEGSDTKKPFYTVEEGKTLKHENIMQDWETKLRFVIGGKDE